MSWEDNQERYNTGLSDEVLIINHLAEKYGYSRAVVKVAVQSPMKFIYDTCKDIPTDYKGPMPVFKIRRLGSIKPKWKFSKEYFKKIEDEK
jgi:hypothetical protein